MADPQVPDWKRGVFSFIRQFMDPEMEILQKTSGTTGDPREYRLRRESMLGSAWKTLDYFGLLPGASALLCLPIHYIAGKMMVVRAMLGELNLVLAEPSGRPLTGLTGPVSFGAMVPLQVYETIHSGDNLSLIGQLLIGGGELHPSVRVQLRQMTAPVVFESFAMTETYTHFALKRINGDQPDGAFRLLEGVHASLDKRGCLQVDMPGVTEGRVETNDLVELNSDGSGFRWLGRVDNVINSGGIKIIPEVLEEKIRELIGCHCLLLSEEDPKLGNRMVLMVEWEGVKPPEEQWANMLKKSLSPFEVPKRLVVVKKIPLNNNFKPDRTSARKLLALR